ncbi:MAG: YidC/Oxa1 family membrane protein insertase [Fusobacteriota bacterium]
MSAIADFIGMILQQLYSVFGNYGISIIGITLLIKFILFPLTLKQSNSMKDMKKIQPEVDKLKEKYSDDKETLNQKTMELYKEHNVNPLGGCLPILLQMPILWSLFRVLRRTGEEAIIPENATFLIWKLTETDPFFVLPILNGLVAFAQQKVMSADTSQNKQAQMMQYFFPVMILMISFNMPVGLQLYWLTSSAFSFFQQLYITKKGEEEKVEKQIENKSKK